MKKGSKAKHCYKCHKIVGWEIPTGKYHHGIPEVKIQLKDNGRIVEKGMGRYYYCQDCNTVKGNE